MNLKNKTVYIVGGLGKIGAEVLSGLLAYNATVIVLDKDIKQQNPFAESETHNVTFLEIDCANIEAAEITLQQAMEEFGCPDVFINCSYPRTEDWPNNSFEKISLQSMRKNIDIHLNSYIWLAKVAADFMKKENKEGSIIFTSSIYGIKAQDLNLYSGCEMAENLTYGVIKAGILQGSRQMASYYGQFNIRVNAICPGGVEDQNQHSSFVDKYSSKTPLSRLASPSDLVGTYIFLSSDLSSYITGETLMVDGGISIV